MLPWSPPNSNLRHPVSIPADFKYDDEDEGHGWRRRVQVYAINGGKEGDAGGAAVEDDLEDTGHHDPSIPID